MSRTIRACFLPSLIDPGHVRDSIAVMIDVLRASTTIVHALDAGAECVIPCAEVDDARHTAGGLDVPALLGGERGGERIDGFDLDNSPLAYTPDSVGGRTIVFTTTNGTRALLAAREADRILIGAFVNLGAVVDALAVSDAPVLLVCAGTNGRVTGEDVLFAGAVVDELGTRTSAQPDDQARIAMDFYRANSENHGSLHDAIRSSLGARNLTELGFDADVERAAMVDLFRLVPAYSATTNRIAVAVSEVEQT